MLARKHTGHPRRFTPLAGLALAVAGLIGCSGQQVQTSLVPPVPSVHPVRLTAADQNLAAADTLGHLIFGGAPAVAEPQLPAHWTVAQASPRR